MGKVEHSWRSDLSLFVCVCLFFFSLWCSKLSRGNANKMSLLLRILTLIYIYNFSGKLQASTRWSIYSGVNEKMWCEKKQKTKNKKKNQIGPTQLDPPNNSDVCDFAHRTCLQPTGLNSSPHMFNFQQHCCHFHRVKFPLEVSFSLFQQKRRYLVKV